jgi:hypothetical protein
VEAGGARIKASLGKVSKTLSLKQTENKKAGDLAQVVEHLPWVQSSKKGRKERRKRDRDGEREKGKERERGKEKKGGSQSEREWLKW